MWHRPPVCLPARLSADQPIKRDSPHRRRCRSARSRQPSWAGRGRGRAVKTRQGGALATKEPPGRGMRHAWCPQRTCAWSVHCRDSFIYRFINTSKAWSCSEPPFRAAQRLTGRKKRTSQLLTCKLDRTEAPAGTGWSTQSA